MCPGEMRNLAPACLNGLGAAYLSGGISAVSAQCVEHRHKYRSMNTVMNAIPSSYAAHVLLGLLQLLTIEDVWSKLEEKISVQLFMQCHMRAIEMFRFQTVPPPHSSDFLPFFFFRSRSVSVGKHTMICKPCSFVKKAQMQWQHAFYVCWPLTKDKDNSWHACSGPPSPLDSYYAADV